MSVKLLVVYSKKQYVHNTITYFMYIVYTYTIYNNMLTIFFYENDITKD